MICSRFATISAVFFLFLITSDVVAASGKKSRVITPLVLDNEIVPGDVGKHPYHDYVARCLENLMEYGTDQYGSVKQPLLVTTLDVRNKKRPQSPKISPTHWRCIFGVYGKKLINRAGGCEPLTDQPLVEVFYLLSKQTGKPQYAKFADSYLHSAMSLTCNKDLFWWGTHRYYDVDEDKKCTNKDNHHEINLPCARWEYLWKVDPDATRAEIEAIWKWHVVNKDTGEHNRHANGKRGRSFPISGGAFVHAFAFLYSKTKQPEHLRWARLVADHHWQNRDRTTGLLPGQTGTGRDRFDGQHSDTSVTGIYCHYLLKSYELTGDKTFRDQAIAYLTSYARYGYDPKSGKFFGSLRLDGTPELGPRATKGYESSEARGFVDLWEPRVLAYEYPIYTAQAYAYAYQLTGNPLMLKTAKRWAEWIRRDPPSKGCLLAPIQYVSYAKHYSHHGTFAGKYGRTISLFLHLYALTGRHDYLDDAQDLAREAISKLYYRGLFRGHPASANYCSADGVGFLLRALLQLDATLENPKLAFRKKCVILNQDGAKIGFENW
ncbi:MAG: hypothetical protein PVH19_03975 [Planctomycetia bacterium]